MTADEKKRTETRGMFKRTDAAPEWLQAKLNEQIDEDDEIRLGFLSDMTLQGQYESEALVVTDQRVMVLNSGQASPLRELPLEEVCLVKVRNHVGNGILVLVTWEKNVETLRYSASLMPEMEEFNDELGQFLVQRLSWEHPEEHEERIDHQEEENSVGEAAEKAKRCPECGQLLPRDRDICTACLNRTTVLRRMIGYLKPYKKLAGVTVFLSFSVAALGAAMPWLLGEVIIDRAVRPGNMQLLGIFVGVVAVLFLTRAGVIALRKVAMAKLAQNVIYDLRQKVYTHLQQLSMSFHDKQSTGRLISRVVSDTNRLQRFLVGQMQRFLIDFLLLSTMLVWMLSTNWKLTLMLWFPLPIYYFLIKWYRDNVHQVLKKSFRKRAAMSGHLADTIPGISMVKAFSQEDRAIDEFNEYSDSFRQERVKAKMFSAKFTAAFLFLTQIGIILVYWYGGRAAIEEPAFQVGSLVTFSMWARKMYQPVKRFARLTEQFENAATSAERVFEVLDTESVVSKNESKPGIQEVDDCIEFDDVSFSYELGPRVLDNISFTVNAEETVGIVGPSGSGKSTLIKLLCRFYEPDEGEIRLDGMPLSMINLESYREQIAMVGQSPFLFRDSILENIRYGRPEASRAEVIRAAKIANVHEFVMNFPEAYDTDARERGSRFSGGERQRICIARAVLKDPTILILDEATSSVDTQNEKLIQAALDRLIEDRTTFIIAHRLSTLRNADKILMMEEGQVVDFAPHTILMNRCDSYRQLVQAQMDLSGTTPEQEPAQQTVPDCVTTG